MLSSHADPLLSIPPTVPWRAPVAPLSASAIVLNCVVFKTLGMEGRVSSRLQARVCFRVEGRSKHQDVVGGEKVERKGMEKSMRPLMLRNGSFTLCCSISPPKIWVLDALAARNYIILR